jgi:hypothetical protein
VEYAIVVGGLLALTVAADGGTPSVESNTAPREVAGAGALAPVTAAANVPACRAPRDYLMRPGASARVRFNGRLGVMYSTHTVVPGTRSDVVAVKRNVSGKNIAGEPIHQKLFDNYQVDAEGLWQFTEGSETLDPPALLLSVDYCIAHPARTVTFPSGIKRECVVLNDAMGWDIYYCAGLGWIASQDQEGRWAFEPLSVTASK